jgi:hypothetical protein
MIFELHASFKNLFPFYLFFENGLNKNIDISLRTQVSTYWISNFMDDWKQEKDSLEISHNHVWVIVFIYFNKKVAFENMK